MRRRWGPFQSSMTAMRFFMSQCTKLRSASICDMFT